MEESFAWNIITDGSNALIGDQQWKWSQTDHYVETMASRVDVGESSFLFTADTGPDWDINQLGETVSLAISESTFLADREHEGILHLSARQAGQFAKKVNAGHLVLSHLAPGESKDDHALQASQVFNGPITVASAGDQYNF
jgi:ribonuclease BN (tRNA processing enzyme)